MARNRMIKPDFWADEKMSAVSRDARLAFIGLWTHSDDFGVVRGHALWLKNHIFPYDGVKIPTMQKWLDELLEIGVIRKFEKNGEGYYYIPAFLTHQTIDKPSQKLRNPEAPEEIRCIP